MPREKNLGLIDMDVNDLALERILETDKKRQLQQRK